MKKYLVIGSGRWAHHLLKSLALAGVPHSNWARKTHSESDLQKELETATHVWLAISDRALQSWTEKLSSFRGLVLHSSGALEFPNAISVHPLMSFPQELYPDEFYARFAFVTTSELPAPEVIPGLKNPFFRIPAKDKMLYHALCVLAGNGSVVLWQKFFSGMKKLGLEQNSLNLYAERISQNILQNPESALTGPLVRNDEGTLRKDLEALTGDAFGPVLLSLIEAYREERRGAI